MALGLPVNKLVTASINLSPTAAQTANFNNLLIIGDSDVIDTTTRIRTYGSLAAVANDFGLTAPEYLAAASFFGQIPQPTQLYIGRWAQSATKGLLNGAPLTVSEQAVSNWTSITSGGVNISIDGVAKTLTALNFSGVTNMNGVASIITTALAGSAVCTWNGTNFVIKSATTGTTSTVSYATTGAGTDISTKLKMTALTAALRVTGIVAESAAAAVLALDSIATQWYALQIASINVVPSDHLAVAAYIEGTGQHIYFVTSQDPIELVSTNTTSIGYLLKQAGYNRTFTQYSSTNPYAVASLAGRELTVAFGGTNTTITVMYKQEPGIVAEQLTLSQAAALDANNVAYFASFNNNTAIIVNDRMASGQPLDTIHGLDWQVNLAQTNVFNVLYLTPTKVPQTDAGIHQIVTAIESAFAQGVNNGLLAPGNWNAPGFGTLKQGDFMPTGFYVYPQPIALQNASDRGARKSPLIQCAVKIAGAVDTVAFLINVNA